MNSADKRLPRYIKFAHRLQTTINKGDYLPGEKLPSQRELAKQFGTTLMTIRKALTLLEDEGLIRTEHGVGTFVVNPHLPEHEFQLLGFDNEMTYRSHGPIQTQILAVQPHIQHEKARQALKLAANSTVTLLERVRLINNRPFVYQQSFLPPQLTDVARNYKPTLSLYETIQTETGQLITLAKEYVTPTLLSAAPASRLAGKAGEPAWLSVRVSATQTGLPVIYDEAILNHDTFVITIERLGRRTSCQLKMLDETSPDIFTYLTND